MSPDVLPLTPRALEGLRRLARGLIRRDDLAEDAVHDAYLLARRRGPVASLGWLGGFVRNRARQLLRGEGRRRRRETTGLSTRASVDPGEHAAALEQQRIVLEELERLPEPFRRALWLRFFAGHGPREAAAAQDVPPATERSRVHRGLELLRARLDARHPRGRAGWALALLPLARSRGGAAALAGLLLSAGALAFLALRPGVQAPPPAAPASGPAGRPTLLGRSAPGAPAARGELAAAALEARVRLPSGAPARGAWVYALAKGRVAGEAAWPVVSAQADADGRVRLTVPRAAAHWLLVAPPPESGAARLVLDGAELPVEPGPAELDLGLPPARRLAITLLAPEGVDPVEAHVEVRPAERDLAVPWPGPDEPMLAHDALRRIDAARFEATFADPLPRRVRVEAPGCAVAEPVTAAQAALHVILAPSPVLRLRVEGLDGPLPPGVAASLEALGNGVGGTPAAGRVEHDCVLFDAGLALHPCRVGLTVPGCLPAWVTLAPLEAGESREVRVRLERCGPPGALRLALGGARAPGPTQLTDGRGLVLVRPAGRGAPWALRAARLERDGSIVLPELPPVPHDVVVVDGRAPAAALLPAVPVPAGGTGERSVRLEPAAFWRLPTGAPEEAADALEVELADGERWPLHRWDAAGPVLADSGPSPRGGSRLGPYPARGGPPALLVRHAGAVRRQVLLPSAPDLPPRASR